MSRFQDLQHKSKRRLLTAAREHLIGRLETTTSGYEEELDVVLKADMELRREADIQQLLTVKEEGPSLDQEDLEPPHIKEELEEADVTKFPLTPVKSEDDEEEPQSSQLHQRHTGHMEPEAAGEDCGEPGLHRDSDPGPHRNPDPDNEQSNDWTETREPQSGLNSNKTVSVSDSRVGAGEKPFHCSECAKRFSLKGTLKEHMRSHTGEKPFSCSVCKRSFGWRGSLLKHMRIHTGEKPYDCSVCGKRFPVYYNLVQHMSIHTGEKRFHCSVCDQRFTWFYQLRNHKCVGRQLHQRQTEQMEADGEDCGGPQPARNSDPDGHLQLSSSDEASPFSQPGTEQNDDWKETREPQSVLNSLNKEEVPVSADKKPFSCSDCGKRFGTKGTLKEHMKIHTGEKPFSCSVCGKRFSRNGHLTQHMPVHTGEKPFGCRICHKKFSWRSNAKIHKCVGRKSSQLHQTEEVKEAEPPTSSSAGHIEPEADREDCGGPGPGRNSDPDDRTGNSSEETDDSEDWKETREPNEEVPVGDGEKPFGCSECGKRFDKEKNLKIHMSNHKGEKRFSCSLCKKSFRQRGHFQKHMKRHTEEKMFNCSVCAKMFGTKTCLKRHTRIHTGEKPFSCSVCKKSFSQSGSLQKHMVRHTGDKRFSCTVCNQRFTWRYQIQRHECVGLQTEEVREAEPTACRSAEQMETRTDGEDCGGPEPDRNPDPKTDVKNRFSSELKPEVNEDNYVWKESSRHFSGPQSHRRNHTGEEQFTEEISQNMIKQEDPELPHIKEELEEADVTKFPFTPVKSEDDEEEPQSSQLHQRHTEHMEPEAAGEDYGGPEPHRDSDPDDKTRDSSEPETDDSEDWQETREPQSGLNSLGKEEVPVSEKLFGCSECGKRFSTTTCLKRHMKIHTGEKPFGCSVCNKSFSQKGDLQKHMRTHTGEKPFSCSACGKAFSESGNLKRHVRSHIGEKPFNCSVCKKSYSKNGDLQNHMMIHQKQFSCPVCNRRFTRYNLLKYHQCVGRHSHETDKFREAEPPASSSAEEMEIRADGKDLGGPEPDRNADPDRHPELDTVQQLLVVKEEGPSLDQEDLEPPHIKVELEEADVTKFQFTPVKSEDDEEEPQSLQLHQRHTEHMQPEAVGEDCGGPGPHWDSDPNSDDSDKWKENEEGPDNVGEKLLSCSVCKETFTWQYQIQRHECVGLQTEECEEAEPPASSSDPDIQPEPETNIKTEPSSEPDDSVDIEFWKETRQHQSGFTYQRRKRVSVNDGYNSSKKASSCSNDKDHSDPDLSGPKNLEVSGCTGCNTDMKPFIGQTVAKNESLHSHTTGHMTEEKPLHCSVCNTGCSDSESLVQHMRIHTRQTQFRCTICGAEFAWRRYLEKHLEVHTKEKFYSCRDCDQIFTVFYNLRNHKCVGRQSSQIHQTEEVREAEPPTSSSDPDIKPEPETVQQLLVVEEEGPSLDQEDQEPLHIKEEQEELWTSQEGGQLEGLEEADITKFPFTPVPLYNDSAAGKPFSCSECGKRFGIKTCLNRHIRSHKGEKCFSCSVCQKSFTRRETIQIHMRVHTGEKPYSCDVCKKTFTWHSQMERHECVGRQLSQIHQTEEIREAEPPTSSSDPHIHQEPETVQQPLIVKEEGPSLDQENLEPPHIKEEPQEADVTKVPFTFVPVKREDDEEEPQSSQLHQRHIEHMQPEAVGEDCGGPGPHRHSDPDYKTGDSSESETDDSEDWKETREPQSGLNSLNNEEVPTSAAAKPFSCSECGKRFGIKTCLNRHIRSHKGEKCFSCSVCKKSFTRKESIQAHMRVHTGEKPYSCSGCGKRFGTKGNLNIHMRIHTGEKPFSCSVCGKKFTAKNNLVSHMNIHSGEKQLICSVCDRTFSWYSSFKSHKCVRQQSSNPHQTLN